MMKKKTWHRAAVRSALCVLALAASANAAAEAAFVRITNALGQPILGDQPDIKGVTGALNSIRVLATEVGLNTSTGTFGQPGVPQPVPLVLTKPIDRSSPRLLRSAFIGERLTAEIVWYMTLADGTGRQSVSIKLENAFVTGIETSATLSGNNASNLETVKFTYQKITFTVPNLDATGAVNGNIVTCLNIASATPC